MQELVLMLLLLTANGSPIVARHLLGDRLDMPLDGGMVLSDGRRLFGATKTLRGLVAALLSTTLAALAVGWPWHIGVLVAVFAMLGDSTSSFVKRRLDMAPSTGAPGLDHVPESLLPLLACKPLLDLSWSQVVLLSLGFMAADLVLSRLLHGLGVRKHPY